MTAGEPLAAGVELVLRGTPETIRALLAEQPAAVLDRDDGHGWTPRDVVVHLLAVERPAFGDRLRLMLAEDDPEIPNIDGPEAMERSALRGDPIGVLLERFGEARAQTLGTLEGYAAEDLARGARHDLLGAISAADLVHHFAHHDLVHIAQIANMLAPTIDARRGPMRGIEQ